MWEDPIVAEVHRTREKLAAEYGFDIETMFAALRKREASLGARLVPQKKRAEPTAEANGNPDSDSLGSTSSEAAPAA